MIETMVESITRFLTDRRARKVEAMRERKRQKRVEEEAAKTAYVAYERDHYAERLQLGRELLDEAPRYAQKPEVQWAVDRFGYWWLAGWGWIYVDHRGRLWLWSEKHWWHVPPDKLMDSPEVLAASVPTCGLRAALRGLRQERSSFWWTALLEEVCHRLGFRGRPI
jgi:hypothetical protein